ncbi:MAG TPA: hypothetical protein VFC00_14430 [Micromonosporaceae bacterium]|nr:hypothetical protein [Micromonosporaceae bacterium]
MAADRLGSDSTGPGGHGTLSGRRDQTVSVAYPHALGLPADLGRGPVAARRRPARPAPGFVDNVLDDVLDPERSAGWVLLLAGC